MKATLLLALTTLLLTFNSCKEKKDWPCDEGLIKTLRVAEAGTGVPVPGARVRLFTEGPDLSNFHLIGEYTTNEDGYLTWPCSWAVSEICAEADGYWDECRYDGHSVFETMLADDVYELSSKAWAKIYFVDEEPYEVAIYSATNSLTQDAQLHSLDENTNYQYVEVIGGVPDSLYIMKSTQQNNYFLFDRFNVLVNPRDTMEFYYTY